MEDRIRELEMEVMGLKFNLELLMDKFGVNTEDIQTFAKKCLETIEKDDKKTDMYYFLMGAAYQEKAAEMLLKEKAEDRKE